MGSWNDSDSNDIIVNEEETFEAGIRVEPSATDSEMDPLSDHDYGSSPSTSFTSEENPRVIPQNTTDDTNDVSSTSRHRPSSHRQLKKNLNDNATAEPAAKCAKIMPVQDMGTNSCSICFESWTSGGEHRLTSLQCGHLFGESCIKTWFNSSKHNKYCPTCKMKTSVKKLRVIYAMQLTCVDNTEIEELKVKLEEKDMEIARKTAEIDRLLLCEKIYNNKIKSLEQQLCNRPVIKDPPWKKWYFQQIDNIEIGKNSESRVFTHRKQSNTLFVSQYIKNNLFPGYGIRQMDCETSLLGRVLYLHTKEIRDVSYSEQDDLVMSVGLDKYIKFLQYNGEKECISVETELPLWSCCWDKNHQNRFFVGCVNGVILQYDIRQTRSCLARLTNPSDVSPVVSIKSVSQGLISCQLNSLNSHKKFGQQYVHSKLPFEGPFTGLNYDPMTEFILLSTRPSTQTRYCQHIVCALTSTTDIAIRCDALHTFKGSQILSRMSKSCMFSILNDNLFSTYNESFNAINVWSIKKETKICSIANNVPILDMCTWNVGVSKYLAALSESKTQIYKVVYEE